MNPTIPLDSAAVEVLIDQLGELPQLGIGRHADNVFVLNFPKVSGHHAQLTVCGPSSFLLEDLGSKNGTFVNGYRCVRKVIDLNDRVQFADQLLTVPELLQRKTRVEQPKADTVKAALSSQETVDNTPKNELGKIDPLDFTQEFAQLQVVYEQYPQLRKACRNRDKLIRTGSVIISSIVGVSAVLSSGGGALPFLHLLSGAGLGILIPTLSSTLLSTDEKLEVIEKEYRERYRCPNPACRDPFLNREWPMLAQQKTCRRCKAIWVNATE